MELPHLGLQDPGMYFPQIQFRQDEASSSSSQPPQTPASSALPATLQQPPSSSAPPAAAVAAPSEAAPAAPAASAAAAAPAPSAPAAAAPAAPVRLPDNLMHKNRLQEFAQRSNIALPMYQTTNEGSSHAPRFRSTVWVDGRSYTSQITFPQRKAAEQDAARVAFESLSETIKQEGCPLVCENTLFSKSILNEFATKLSVERPTYNTIQLEGLLPLFESSLVFSGTKYTGETARNKKEAEQLAARAAILAILGGPSSGALYEIIKSKSRMYAATKPNKSQDINASAVGNTGQASDSQDHKDKGVAGPVAVYNNQTQIELVPSKMVSSHQEFQMPEYVPSAVSSAEATNLPNVSLQPGGSEQAVGDGSSSKKRRKSKKKANKKARMESPLPIAAFPCSVAQ